MIFGSVCSGIEAASVAWDSMDWEASFLSEIDPFARSALQHHYPKVPLHGDFTTIKRGQYDAIDVLVGGTPCQSFSIAGLRKGLDDPRGNLMLGYLALADKYRPDWLVWENVPGVLSSNGGRDFGTFLGGLGQLGYGFAYRVLDAQYFGVPQRRRRVFVVGCLGDWRRAAAVLFERHSLQGNPAPRRKAGQNITGAITRSAFSGGASGRPEGAAAGHFQAVASTLNAGGHSRNPLDETLLPVVRSVALRGRDGGSALEIGDDQAFTLRASSGGGDKPHVLAFDCKASGMGHSNSHQNGGGHLAVCVTGDITHTLKAEGFDASEDGTGRGQPITTAAREVAQCLTSNYGKQCDNSDTALGPNVAIQGMAVRRLTPRECERLQGFPDDYTLVPHRGKSAADGPRYKALGNSMAVPVMRWIGERIQTVDAIMQANKEAA